jgi:hypothetical protein
MALILGSSPFPAPAEDGDTGQVVVKGSLTAGAQAVGESVRSSKFTEYRDVPRGTFVQALTFDLSNRDFYASIAARNLGQADQQLAAGFGSRGKLRVDLGYNQTPHRFSFFGATPYVEMTPGILP